MIEKTFDVNLWAISKEHLQNIYLGYEIPRLINKNIDMESVGYIRIGTGILTANLIAPKETLKEKVELLEAMIRHAKSDAQMTITRLSDQINKLQEICHDSGE